jgi:uncharacterized membrane protein
MSHPGLRVSHDASSVEVGPVGETIPAPSEARPKLDTVSELETRTSHDRSIGEMFVGFAVQKAGSLTFVSLHLVAFAAWIAANLGCIQGVAPFDPVPFGLFSFVVPLEAIFLALLTLIAQNRMTKEADRRAWLDLQVNVLAERESTKTLAMLQRIGAHLGLEEKTDEEANRLARKTNVGALAEELEKDLS